MKKIILLIFLIGFATMLKAQDRNFHDFKFDIGLGYALPSSNFGSGTKAGVTFTLQPHYRLSDDFALGLRMEAAAIGYDNGVTGDVKVRALASACLSGEYYLSDKGFRPFVGAGTGLYDAESGYGNTNSSGISLSARTQKLGAYPEIGFEAGHLRISVEYNTIGNNNNYVAFKLGAFIGGGRKNNK